MRYVGDKHRQPIFFLSSDPSSPCLLLLLSRMFLIVEPPWGCRVIMELFLLFGQSGPARTGRPHLIQTHTDTCTLRLYIYIHIYQKTVYCTCSCCVPTACYDCTYSSAPLTQCCVTNTSTLSPPLCLGWQLFDFSISQTAPQWSS